ncbi:hypothetical protein F5Y17DRAFT_460223 [Xylariaceae sp. FL0594]|nr:hypothetical protein F5Y17DRAFT_460223 [Xylariaceae sp. FL0594]
MRRSRGRRGRYYDSGIPLQSTSARGPIRLIEPIGDRYQDCFVTCPNDLRTTDLVEHEIVIKEGFKPFRLRQPYYSPVERAFAQRIFPQMKKPQAAPRPPIRLYENHLDQRLDIGEYLQYQVLAGQFIITNFYPSGNPHSAYGHIEVYWRDSGSSATSVNTHGQISVPTDGTGIKRANGGGGATLELWAKEKNGKVAYGKRSIPAGQIKVRSDPANANARIAYYAGPKNFSVVNQWK